MGKVDAHNEYTEDIGKRKNFRTGNLGAGIPLLDQNYRRGWGKKEGRRISENSAIPEKRCLIITGCEWREGQLSKNDSGKNAETLWFAQKKYLSEQPNRKRDPKQTHLFGEQLSKGFPASSV